WEGLSRGRKRCFIDKPNRCGYLPDVLTGRDTHSFFKEVFMVEVTPSATQQIAEYFKGKDVSPIRIFLNEGG
ncbi:MAG: hypothetical protein LJE63_03690, partial [Desulfobacteraceae bacterium]|nr:hypothetical protein [Desulfobacteraceae bacterium]